MRLSNTCIFAALLAMPATAHSYPLEDTEFLKSAYCFHMSKSPRLEVDLTGTEKEGGGKKFFEALLARDLEFPQGEHYKDIRKKFIAWVIPRFHNQSTGAALTWYRENCLSSSQ